MKHSLTKSSNIQQTNETAWTSKRNGFIHSQNNVVKQSGICCLGEGISSTRSLILLEGNPVNQTKINVKYGFILVFKQGRNKGTKWNCLVTNGNLIVSVLPESVIFILETEFSMSISLYHHITSVILTLKYSFLQLIQKNHFLAIFLEGISGFYTILNSNTGQFGWECGARLNGGTCEE